MARETGALPLVRTPIPGPESRALAARLARVESRNVTALTPHPPIFWAEAHDANVVDVDGNVYIDLTSGFGVAFAGHSNRHVAEAIRTQAARLAHGLGDVHPPEIKVRLLEKLAQIAPADLSVAILGSDGSDAVEAALKTAVMRTGRTGVLAFEGAYHGLTYGALSVTWRSDFRSPFREQLNPAVWFAPYPAGVPDPEQGALDKSLDAVTRALAEADAAGTPIGAIIVEPIQGRGGLIVPPAGFLQALRDLCDGESRILIFDEVYTGMGRTGEWFSCQKTDVYPDVATIGKALTGSIPLSAAIGRPAVMEGWPASEGEGIHTSTFLGNPVACAAALGQIEAIESGGYLGRAIELGARIRARTTSWLEEGLIQGVRGDGLIQGARVRSPSQGLAIAGRALELGVLMLAEGDGSVLALTPPACITGLQLDHALDVIEQVLRGRASRD